MPTVKTETTFLPVTLAEAPDQSTDVSPSPSGPAPVIEAPSIAPPTTDAVSA
jgi:hypothetical protein